MKVSNVARPFILWDGRKHRMYAASLLAFGPVALVVVACTASVQAGPPHRSGGSGGFGGSFGSGISTGRVRHEQRTPRTDGNEKIGSKDSTVGGVSNTVKNQKADGNGEPKPHHNRKHKHHDDAKDDHHVKPDVKPSDPLPPKPPVPATPVPAPTPTPAAV